MTTDDRVRVGFQRLPHGRDLELPARSTGGSAGLDLRAAVADLVELAPGDWCAVPTGLCVAIPAGFEGQVRPRSGLARRHGVSVLNTPGTIDSDYRGEVLVLLINHGRETFEIARGDRVAQLLVSRVPQAELVEVEELSDTCRGTAGFGSTGVR